MRTHSPTIKIKINQQIDKLRRRNNVREDLVEGRVGTSGDSAYAADLSGGITSTETAPKSSVICAIKVSAARKLTKNVLDSPEGNALSLIKTRLVLKLLLDSWRLREPNLVKVVSLMQRVKPDDGSNDDTSNAINHKGPIQDLEPRHERPALGDGEKGDEERYFEHDPQYETT